MIITSVQVRDTKTENRLEGIASVTLDDMIVVHDIKIIRNADGNYFLAMPSRKLPNGNFKDIAHPISKEVRNAIENIIIGCFESMRNNGSLAMMFVPGDGRRKNSMLEQSRGDFVEQSITDDMEMAS